MNDDQSLPVAPPQPDPAATQVVDDLVQQGSAIQDLFAQNDATTVQPADDPANATNTDQTLPQKSPLDILEEILSKEEQQKEAVAPVTEGPSPEELARQAQIQAQEQQLIEAQRLKMQTEVGSAEQKQRDAIRQQQTDANKVVNPFEIIQLERKKIAP